MPFSAAYRLKLAELTEKGLKGEALVKALEEAMKDDATVKEAKDYPNKDK